LDGLLASGREESYTRTDAMPEDDHEVPWSERRLQKPMMHYQHVEVSVFPETRKNMMKQHARQAVRYEYLHAGQEPAKFEEVDRSKRIYDQVSAIRHLGGRMVHKDGRWVNVA
jgi:thiamine biosynthesis protein ThiC